MANLNQLEGLSMKQIGEKFGKMEMEMERLKKEAMKLTEENTGLKKKLKKVEEELAGKNAKLDEMKKQMNEIGTKNAELNGQIVEKNEEIDKMQAEIQGLAEESVKLGGKIWSMANCGPIIVTGEGGLFVTHSGPEGINSIRAILPFQHFNLNDEKPPNVGYFEVQIVDNNPSCAPRPCIPPGLYAIGIGFCTRQFLLEGKWLGEEENSIGILDKDGMRIDGQLKEFGNANGYFKVGNVIGAGIIHYAANNSMKCFGTLNGQLLGKLELPNKFASIQLFPAITMSKEGDSIRANFGREKWRFNFSQLLQ